MQADLSQDEDRERLFAEVVSIRRCAGHPGQQRGGDVPAPARRLPREAGPADDGDARRRAAASEPVGDPGDARARAGLDPQPDVGRRRPAARAAVLRVRRSAGFGIYGTVKAALNRLTKSLAAELYDDGIAVNAAAPSNPVATPGAGTLDLAKTDTEDISLITETAFTLCTGDPRTLTGRIAQTQPFLREIGWLVHDWTRRTSASLPDSTIAPLAGGASSLTFRGCGRRPVVVKVAPPGLPPVLHRDVLRQARMLARSAARDVPVPEVLWEDRGDPPDVRRCS